MEHGGWRMADGGWAKSLIAAIAFFVAASAAAQGFDHEHKAWSALLKKHVVLVDEPDTGGAGPGTIDP